jgi:beta-lactamase regulating signal transducer with metallopeptidase domain
MNLIKPKPTINSYSIWLLKRFINNLNHYGLGYLTLLMALYIFTPLPLQLNTWPVKGNNHER